MITFLPRLWKRLVVPVARMEEIQANIVQLDIRFNRYVQLLPYVRPCHYDRTIDDGTLAT